MITRIFPSFTVEFRTMPTMENYHVITFQIEKDDDWHVINGRDCGLAEALLLASESETDVKEGIRRVIESREFWTNRLKHLI